MYNWTLVFIIFIIQTNIYEFKRYPPPSPKSSTYSNDQKSEGNQIIMNCNCNPNIINEPKTLIEQIQNLTQLCNQTQTNNNNNNNNGNVQPSPSPPEQFLVQLVNECNVTIFAAALGPTAIQPLEGNRWLLQPNEFITINIPQSWQSTAGQMVIGPRFWARTGCRYNVQDNKAQCETGDCGNFYDCSASGLAGKAPLTIAEFCFNCGNNFTFYDISLVDGYSISATISPGTHSARNPLAPGDQFWCKAPICQDFVDLRSICPANFLLFNSDLSTFNPCSDVNTSIACFSNCGKYEFPTAPSLSCDPTTDEICARWRQFCCQSRSNGQACLSDDDCLDEATCFQGTCQCRAFYLSPPCAPNICTNQDAQPIPGNCTADICIGDDTVHSICPRAFSWPNDPQTYDCDATNYIITFCPGGSNTRISQSNIIPLCDTLSPQCYDFNQAIQDCGPNHGKYLCAFTIQSGLTWSCNVDTTPCNGQICQFA